MHQIDKLSRKLNFWPSIKKKVAIVGLAAALLVPSSIFGLPKLAKMSAQSQAENALTELCNEPIEESIIAPIIKESLDDVVLDPPTWSDWWEEKPFAFQMNNEHKKYDQLITKVSERTNTPKYILAAFIDYAHQCSAGSGAMHYYWDGFVQINSLDAGLSRETLWKDKEQCLMSMAHKYQLLFNNVQDETVALALMFQNKDTIRNNKKEAKKHTVLVNHYQTWRTDQKKSDILVKFDDLVEKYIALSYKDWKKRDILEEEIKTMFVSILKDKIYEGLFDSPVINHDAYRAALHPTNYQRKQWWVNNSNCASLIKTALRLKRDGYNTQPIGELRDAAD